MNDLEKNLASIAQIGPKCNPRHLCKVPCIWERWREVEMSPAGNSVLWPQGKDSQETLDSKELINKSILWNCEAKPTLPKLLVLGILTQWEGNLTQEAGCLSSPNLQLNAWGESQGLTDTKSPFWKAEPSGIWCQWAMAAMMDSLTHERGLQVRLLPSSHF